MILAPPASPSSSRARWESVTDWPLTVTALTFLAAYAWPILSPESAMRPACRVVTWVAWGLFVVDYLARLWLSESRWAFVRGHLVDLAVIALPMLRPLRLLRLVTLLSVLNRHAGTSLRGRVGIYVVGATSLVLLVASLAVLDAERGKPGANINTYPDALWWAVTTVSTVGYGDRYPTTEQGRLLAAGLMLAGIALLGVVTASLASWLIDKVREVEQAGEAATRRDIEALAVEVAALRREIQRDRGRDDERASVGSRHEAGQAH